MTLAIGIDVGGTKVLGGVVDPDGQVIAVTRRETPAGDVAATLDHIVDTITELAEKHPISAVGIGAAGWLDVRREKILFAPNLAWRDEPLRERIASRVQLPVLVENDGNVAAWAEFRFGAGRDAHESMVLVTLGTGVGGGVIIGGQLIRGAHGIGGELGHVRIVPDGRQCGCGRFGCLEQYASGTALVRRARAIATADPAGAALLLDLGHGAVADGPTVTRAAQAGDPAALAAFAEVAGWLGSALADLVQILDPEVLVVGGGVGEAGELLLAPTREAFVRALAARGPLPVAPVRGARLGNLAGVVGAADLARR